MEEKICFVFNVNKRPDAPAVPNYRCLRKKADTAQLQDELTGALIGLARAVDDTSAVSKRPGRPLSRAYLPQLQM